MWSFESQSECSVNWLEISNYYPTLFTAFLNLENLFEGAVVNNYKCDCCKTLKTRTETNYRCLVCEDFDLCKKCYKSLGHHHEMRKTGKDGKCFFAEIHF